MFTSVITLWLFSTPWVTARLVKPLESSFPILAENSNCGSARIIVVLGGGLNPGAAEYGGATVLADSTLNRVHYAAQLSRRCNLQLLTSGGVLFDNTLGSEAEMMRNILEQSFSVNRVLIEPNSRTTAENAINSAARLAELGIRKIVLVTSAYHMTRAAGEFEAQGLDVVPAPTDYIDLRKQALLAWIPNARALLHSRIALHEYLGLLVYRWI